MGLKELAKRYPDEFFKYAEKILDSYFGNIFIIITTDGNNSITLIIIY